MVEADQRLCNGSIPHGPPNFGRFTLNMSVIDESAFPDRIAENERVSGAALTDLTAGLRSHTSGEVARPRHRRRHPIITATTRAPTCPKMDATRHAADPDAAERHVDFVMNAAADEVERLKARDIAADKS